MMDKKQVQLANHETYFYLEKGKGEQVLILVHGNMSSSVHFMPLINSLPNHLRVIAPDLRGFGDSSYLQPIESLKSLSEDLKLFMDQLKIKKASFAGWSTGGGVVLEFAAKYPKMVDKIILIESTTHKGYPIFKKDANLKPLLGVPYASREEMGNDPLQVAPVVKALQDKNFAFMNWLWNASIYVKNKPSEEDNTLYINETLKQRNLVDIDWSLAIMNMSNEDSVYSKGDNTISNVKAPTLIIWSKQDYVVPYPLVEDNYKALKNHATLKIYEQGGHSPIIDNLEELTKDILSFLF